MRDRYVQRLKEQIWPRNSMLLLSRQRQELLLAVQWSVVEAASVRKDRAAPTTCWGRKQLTRCSGPSYSGPWYNIALERRHRLCRTNTEWALHSWRHDTLLSGAREPSRRVTCDCFGDCSWKWQVVGVRRCHSRDRHRRWSRSLWATWRSSRRAPAMVPMKMQSSLLSPTSLRSTATRKSNSNCLSKGM